MLHMSDQSWNKFMGKCCPTVSCLDRPSKLRQFFNGDLPSNNTTQNQPKNSCKPADFRQILQFTCGWGLSVSHSISFLTQWRMRYNRIVIKDGWYWLILGPHWVACPKEVHCLSQPTEGLRQACLFWVTCCSQLTSLFGDSWVSTTARSYNQKD